MALKMKLTAEEYNKLPDDVKKEYKKDGDSYKLDVDDSEIAAEMRRARDREKTRADEAEAQKTELEEKVAKLEGDDARKSGDIAQIEKGWQKKLDKAKADGEEAVAKLKKQLEAALVDGALDTMAAEIFTKPKRDVRLLKDRVYVDFDGDTAVLRVRDKDGKASALTLEDLKKETIDNPEYKDILVGSKATGSGGTGGNSGAGGTKQPHEMNDAERVALARSNPAEFARLFPNVAA